MAPQTVQAHLADVLAQEGIEAEPGALRLLARAARGSMRDGLSLTDQAIAFGAGRVDEAQVRQMLGSADRSHALRLVRSLGARDGAALIAAVDGLRALGLSAAATLEEMAALLQQAAVLQAVADAFDPADADASALAEVAQRFAADELQLVYSIVLHGRAEIALAPDEYSGMVMVLLRWLAFAPAGAKAEARSPPVAPVAASAPVASRALAPKVPTPTSMPARAMAQPAVVAAPPTSRVDLHAAEPPPPWLEVEEPADAFPARPASRTGKADPPPSESSSKVEREPLSAAELALGDRWCGLVTRLIEGGSIAALVRETAWQAQCVEFDSQASPQRVCLRIEREMLRNPAHVDKLQSALSELIRAPLRLEVVPGAARDTPAERDAAERARRQADAEQAIHADPLVRSLMAQYTTARIVPGSVKPI